MDFYKLKWKLKFRGEQIRGWFKLQKFNYIINHNLMGDDEMYYRLTRSNLQDLVKADPEQEYLEEHGLLPDEPEPEEEEPLPEPEPEEPGLIRRMDSFDLLYCPLCVGNAVFFVDELKEFEDRTEIAVRISEDFGNIERTDRAVVPHQDGARYDPVTLDFEAFRWDRIDSRLRFMPLVCEDEAQAAANGPVRTVQNLVLRVDKTLAEERLSPLCLEYAYQCSEVGYDWCMVDHSHNPVLYELKMAGNRETEQDIFAKIGRYCPHYWKSNNLGG